MEKKITNCYFSKLEFNFFASTPVYSFHHHRPYLAKELKRLKSLPSSVVPGFNVASSHHAFNYSLLNKHQWNALHNGLSQIQTKWVLRLGRWTPEFHGKEELGPKRLQFLIQCLYSKYTLSFKSKNETENTRVYWKHESIFDLIKIAEVAVGTRLK